MPWEVCNGIDIYPVGDVEARHYVADCDPDGACLGTMSLGDGEHPHTDSNFETKKADAAFIVRACNSHYDLLDALKWMVENDDTNEGDMPLDHLNGQTWDEFNAYWIDGLTRARTAIAKAEGRT